MIRGDPSGRLGRRRPNLLVRNWGNKAIAASGDRDDIATVIFSVSQRPAQRGDVDGEIILDDDCIGPDAGHKVPLAGKFAGAFDQHDENIESAATEVKRVARIQQKPFHGKQAKWAEQDHGDSGVVNLARSYR